MVRHTARAAASQHPCTAFCRRTNDLSALIQRSQTQRRNVYAQAFEGLRSVGREVERCHCLTPYDLNASVSATCLGITPDWRYSCDASQRSASIAAMQPVPAAVTAWR